MLLYSDIENVQQDELGPGPAFLCPSLLRELRPPPDPAQPQDLRLRLRHAGAAGTQLHLVARTAGTGIVEIH